MVSSRSLVSPFKASCVWVTTLTHLERMHHVMGPHVHQVGADQPLQRLHPCLRQLHLLLLGQRKQQV